MNFFIAALLVLRFFPGNAEVEDEEEISQFLHDYAAHISDYIYSTGYYYDDNTTIIPSTYVYEWDTYETNTVADWWNFFSPEDSTASFSGIPDTDAPGDSKDAGDSQDFQESAGSSLPCHLPLVTLLSLLRVLL